eukprot:TRINITY_DN64387_c0_g1_i1.p1 TRINITY_DN64387_c0_g1~~TRINITY_DN64387_c0_g1_i1.p1  ORF type:complete len:280 (+),score=24.53 TRINITY_DN64387_c0_g1_i1:141-980(+)
MPPAESSRSFLSGMIPTHVAAALQLIMCLGATEVFAATSSSVPRLSSATPALIRTEVRTTEDTPSSGQKAQPLGASDVELLQEDTARGVLVPGISLEAQLLWSTSVASKGTLASQGGNSEKAEKVVAANKHDGDGGESTRHWDPVLYAIGTVDGRYCSDKGKDPVTCNSESVGLHEQFRIFHWSKQPLVHVIKGNGLDRWCRNHGRTMTCDVDAVTPTEEYFIHDFGGMKVFQGHAFGRWCAVHVDNDRTYGCDKTELDSKFAQVNIREIPIHRDMPSY